MRFWKTESCHAPGKDQLSWIQDRCCIPRRLHSRSLLQGLAPRSDSFKRRFFLARARRWTSCMYASRFERAKGHRKIDIGKGTGLFHRAVKSKILRESLCEMKVRLWYIQLRNFIPPTVFMFQRKPWAHKNYIEELAGTVFIITCCIPHILRVHTLASKFLDLKKGRIFLNLFIK